MRSCASCGADLRREATFCTACGVRWIDPLKTRERVLEAHAVAHAEARRLTVPLRLWGALLLLNGAIGLAYSADRFAPTTLDLVGSGIGLLLVLAVVVPDHQVRGLFTTLGAPIGLLLVPAMLAVMGGFMWAYWSVFETLGVQTLNVAEHYRAAGWGPVLPVLLVAVLPPLTEETFFRGTLYARFEEVMKPHEALIVQAALFSILHMLPLVFVSHFVMGLLFGLLRSRTGSLWPSILAHAAWNGWVLAGDWAG